MADPRTPHDQDHRVAAGWWGPVVAPLARARATEVEGDLTIAVHLRWRVWPVVWKLTKKGLIRLIIYLRTADPYDATPDVEAQ